VGLFIVEVVGLICGFVAISAIRLWLIPAPLVEELKQSPFTTTPAQLSHGANITRTGSETLSVSEPVFVTAGQGLEPRKPDPESGVIPFHHPAIMQFSQRLVKTNSAVFPSDNLSPNSRLKIYVSKSGLSTARGLMV
jgi:hypothetical protein